MFSVVITGRNDNFDGNFNNRLFYSIDRMYESYPDHEIIFVEWNNMDDNYLSYELVSKFDHIRCYIVDQDTHRKYCTNSSIRIMEFTAKNVGVRRAKYDWIICTNADCFWNHDLIRFLSRGVRDKSMVYRAVRKDIKSMSDHTVLRTHKITPPVYTNGSGDFFMAHKSFYKRTTGYDEEKKYKCHKDARLCLQAGRFGYKFRAVGTIMHLNHPNSLSNMVGPEPAYYAAWPLDHIEKGLPYSNGPNWGLNQYKDTKLIKSVYKLSE